MAPAELLVVHGRQFPIGTLLYSEPKSPRSDEDEEEEDPENLVGIDSDEDTESDGNDDVDGGFIDPDGEDECVWDIHGIELKGQKSGDAYKCIETVTTDSGFGFESFL